MLPSVRCRSALLALLLVWLAALADPAWAQRRVALVIGNGGYANENRLPNPTNDARLIARTLQDLGFSVELKTDLGKRDMELSIARFTRESSGADSAVFYYAGHGAQLVGGGRNYLLPVDARIDGDDTLESDGIPADRIVDLLERGTNPAKLRLVILDACRNNSLAGKARSGVRGLARMTPSTDYTLIAFSTNDQDVALDGTGANSPYTRALARHLVRAREIPLRRVFELTATEVREATNQQQRPRTYGDLDSRVTLEGRVVDVEVAAARPTPTAPAAPAAAAAEPLPPSEEQVEMQAWTEVKRANVAAGYRAYLAEYPDGRFAKFARIELAKLEVQPAPPPRSAEPAPAARPADTGAAPATRPLPAAAVAATAPVPAPAPAPQRVAIAPPAAPAPRPAAAAPAPASGWDLRPIPGRTFSYQVTDKAYGKRRELTRRVTEVGDNRVVFGNGARVEDGQGGLLAVAGESVSDFELIEPPQGWASLLSGGATARSWTARDGLQLMMDTPTQQSATITLNGKPFEAVVVRWTGRAAWPSDLLGGANYVVRLEISFDPITRRVLQLNSSINANRSGLSGYRNSSEEAMLVGVQ